MLTDPNKGLALFGGNGLPLLQYYFTFQAGLTVYDPQGNVLPRMAQKSTCP